ncbi:RNA-directed DNA polymerase from transposon BS [Paramuricea clavata]|uniref:RNA-directed DNA polymerase from transposon BS n=1 Tax=Paramuricea clavata TaxID=317549 RepID=A0A6S7IH49_PARCT|nr:RNA-directed DNA polymerase from transposon BS [Paramuricea clavata]
MLESTQKEFQSLEQLVQHYMTPTEEFMYPLTVAIYPSLVQQLNDNSQNWKSSIPSSSSSLYVDRKQLGPILRTQIPKPIVSPKPVMKAPVAAMPSSPPMPSPLPSPSSSTGDDDYWPSPPPSISTKPVGPAVKPKPRAKSVRRTRSDAYELKSHIQDRPSQPSSTPEASFTTFGIKQITAFDIPDGSEDQGGEQPPQRRRTLSLDEIHKIQANRNHDYDLVTEQRYDKNKSTTHSPKLSSQSTTKSGHDKKSKFKPFKLFFNRIYDFLTDREQCVKFDDYYSSWKKTNGGLPQVTKLGPLLFAILVNQLLNNWHGCIKFVDDSTAFEIIPRGSPSLLPIVINEISQFASKRGMELNPKKCKEMIITFLKYNHTCFSPIYISGVSVELVSSFKLLGVHLSNDLRWNSHADYIMKKANSRSYSLRKLRKADLKQSDLATVYCSFIRSLLEYATPSWATLSSTLSNEIESIQRRALKIIYPDLSYADALDTTGFDTLIDRRGDACKSFVQKLKDHKSTFRNPLVNILKETPYEPVHNYCLRNSNPPAPLIFTERFRNFVTIKYNS